MRIKGEKLTTPNQRRHVPFGRTIALIAALAITASACGAGKPRKIKFKSYYEAAEALYKLDNKYGQDKQVSPDITKTINETLAATILPYKAYVAGSLTTHEMLDSKGFVIRRDGENRHYTFSSHSDADNSRVDTMHISGKPGQYTSDLAVRHGQDGQISIDYHQINPRNDKNHYTEEVLSIDAAGKVEDFYRVDKDRNLKTKKDAKVYSWSFDHTLAKPTSNPFTQPGPAMGNLFASMSDIVRDIEAQPPSTLPDNLV